MPRGPCYFEAKVRSGQRLGAKGVIVRNTLDSRYKLIDEDADTDMVDGYPDWSNTKWPKEQSDFECGTNKAKNNFGWSAAIDTDDLDFDPPPYNGQYNNVMLTGPAVDGNLCASKGSDMMKNFEKHCPTERCLLTGRNATEDGSKLEACCAWDNHLVMNTDGDDEDAVPQDKEEKIVIPALFVTMENGEELYDLVVDAELNSGGQSVQFVTVVPYARYYPSVHFSSVMVWFLAMFTLWISCYESAKEYRSR